MAKVTGIGGVFLKTRKTDPATLAAWYKKHLGMPVADWGGAVFKGEGATVWTLAENESDWFNPSTGSFMINYRVDDLDEMIAQLKAGGVEIFKGPDLDEQGKFAWILDPDGNKVELWEPSNPL